MNKVKVGSNMYPFLNEMSGGKGYTWNPIRGKCPHLCSYCYVPRIMRGKQGELRLDQKSLKENLGTGNFIFVGSSTDMWAKEVPTDWILAVLEKVVRASGNRYLFQTKNPKRFEYFTEHHCIPDFAMLGITLESNRCWNGSKAPCPIDRYIAFKDIPASKMISIEPIMDFDLDEMMGWMKEIKPKFVSIGADSKGHNLPEPSTEKVISLTEELRKVTVVKVKPNLARLLKVRELPNG